MFRQFIISINEHLHHGFGLAVSLILIVFSLCFAVYFIFFVIHKGQLKTFSKKKRNVYISLAIVSLLTISYTVISGDVYPNLSPQVLAREFTESICSGEIEKMVKYNDNQMISPEYFEQFVAMLNRESQQFSTWFSDIRCYKDIDNKSWRDFLRISNEYYSYDDYPEVYRVTYKLTTIVSDLPPEVDLLFNITLAKISVTSRFLGEYERWRVVNFAYTLSEGSTY